MSCCSSNPNSEYPEPSPEDKKPSTQTEALSCCSSEKTETVSSACCGSNDSLSKQKLDWLLWGSTTGIVLSYLLYLFLFYGSDDSSPFVDTSSQLYTFTHTTFSLINKMWWGLAMGILFAGLLSHIPREFVIATLGPGGKFTSLIRATLAGLMLDLCNHGILMVAMQLYRRGASLGQTVAFLIASPWNSLSLTIILFTLIGWKWTLTFIALSAGIALISGMVFEYAVKRSWLPANPNTTQLPDHFHFFKEAKKSLSQWRLSISNVGHILRDGLVESRMILKWIFFGTILVGLIRTFLPEESFQTWFGPSLAGLALTLLATTIIEVCSEGSSPIASDLVTRANAPGNGFTFLMAGAATDYTEIMALKETTRSWKISLALPVVVVPQVLVISYLLNHLN